MSLPRFFHVLHQWRSWGSLNADLEQFRECWVCGKVQKRKVK